jgi:hypothetical protein
VIKRRFKDRAFTCFPNIVIQDGTDSEIGSSAIFFREARKVPNLYRWEIDKYGLDAIRKQQTRATVAEMTSATTRNTFRPLARLHAWLRERQNLIVRASRAQAATASSMRSISAPRPSSDNQRPGRKDPPLVPFADQQSNVRVVIVLAVGIKADDLPRLLDMMVEKSKEEDIVPIILTDYDDFVSFREHGLIFEYLPPDKQRQTHAPDLDWKLYELRRLTLLRRKWRPINTIAFGASSAQLLREWQASPLWEGAPKAGN